VLHQFGHITGVMARQGCGAADRPHSIGSILIGRTPFGATRLQLAEDALLGMRYASHIHQALAVQHLDAALGHTQHVLILQGLQHLVGGLP